MRDPGTGRALVVHRRWDGHYGAVTPVHEPAPPAEPFTARRRLAGELDRPEAVRRALWGQGLDAMTEAQDVAELSAVDQHPADSAPRPSSGNAICRCSTRSTPRSTPCSGRSCGWRRAGTGDATSAAGRSPTSGSWPCRPPGSAFPTSGRPRATTACADDSSHAVPGAARDAPAHAAREVRRARVGAAAASRGRAGERGCHRGRLLVSTAVCASTASSGAAVRRRWALRPYGWQAVLVQAGATMRTATPPPQDRSFHDDGARTLGEPGGDGPAEPCDVHPVGTARACARRVPR